MEKYYEKIENLGSGAFGDVFSAFHKPTGEIVAVKELKEKFVGSWEDCLNQPEIRCSLALKAHPNIVQLKNVIKNYQSVSLVFELMDANLLEFMQSRQRPYTEAEIRIICFQILKGLAYIHHKGYFHRDLKPENLLVKQGVIKIGDLGSVVEIDSAEPLKSYIGTIWYRAPEVLLGHSSYGPPVDMWAVGAIMAELFTLRPLFPGKDADHQMYKICRVIGSPTWETWPKGINYGLPRADGVRLCSLIPSASESALKLISSLCSWDPHKRPTAAEALQHPFFLGSYRIPRAIVERPVQSIAETELQTLCIQQH